MAVDEIVIFLYSCAVFQEPMFGGIVKMTLMIQRHYVNQHGSKSAIFLL